MSNFAWWCYLLTFTHPYHFQWPWLYFKVNAVSKSFNWKFYVLTWFSWNFLQLSIMSCKSRIYHYFWFLHMFKGDNWHVIWKNFNVGFSPGIIKMRFFKFCMIITFLDVYIIVVGFKVMDVSENINCKPHVLDSWPL